MSYPPFAEKSFSYFPACNARVQLLETAHAWPKVYGKQSTFSCQVEFLNANFSVKTGARMF